MNEWERTLVSSIGLARISKIIPQIPDVGPSPVKGALTSLLLPSLHLLAIVGILDEGLAEYIDANNVAWPSKTKRDLFNRINVVSGVVPGVETALLQRIRERRNSIAHKPDLVLSAPVSWDELDKTIDCVCDTMKLLGMIREVPQIVAFHERTPELFPNEVGPNGERMRHKHTVGAKRAGEVILEFSHEIAYFPPGNL